jgi:hypothetical protein
MAKNRDDFSSNTVKKLAERAAYICSNPGCRRVTIGPDFSNNGASTKTGVGSHIKAASKGGPRYDTNQTTAERSSITNGIWLCHTCSSLIDRNGGADYKEEILYKWKDGHEKFVKECLEGKKRIIFHSFTFGESEANAKKLIILLNDRRVLTDPHHFENPKYAFDSVQEIRKDLRNFRAGLNLAENQDIDIIVESMIKACIVYVSNVPENPDTNIFIDNLEMLRKIVGVNVNELVVKFKLTLPQPLDKILPVT